MAYRRGGRKDNDGKYLRLTGMWQSKKRDNLWSGKLRPEDIDKLIEKAEEAAKAGVELMFFLWENTEKDGPKSPDFTLQVTVAEEEAGSSRSRKSYGRSSSRDRDEERDNERSEGRRSTRGKAEPEEEAEEEPRGEEVEEEKPRRGKPAPATKSKKSDKDW